MLGVNLFTTATLFLTAARAYYIPNSNYVVRVAEAPQYLYTPSENTEELSGYSYVTSDPNGARSNVIFTMGPDAMSLFRNQMGSVEKSVETMVPARMPSAEIESKSEQAGIQRMEEKNEANQSQQQVPVQQPTLFQAQNSLFRHSVYNLPVSAGFHRFYTAPFAIHNRHLQPYIYNPYTHLNTALHPLQVHYRHPFAQLFYPQPVSSITNAIEASQTEARGGSTSEAIVEENLSTENGTISSEVTVEASAASESLENSKEEVTVMSRNMAMENEESNSTEESIGTVSEEMKMEDESSTVSVGKTTDMELTATTSDM